MIRSDDLIWLGNERSLKINHTRDAIAHAFWAIVYIGIVADGHFTLRLSTLMTLINLTFDEGQVKVRPNMKY